MAKVVMRQCLAKFLRRMSSNNILKIAIQKSGRLSEQSLELLKKCGLEFDISERKLISTCQNFPLEILFFRADDIPEIVSDNTVDLGICGQNSITEKGFNLKEIEKMNFGKCRLSIAIPEKTSSKFSFSNKKIATSYPNILKKYLKKNNINAEIVELSGSVEIAPKLGIADAICDLVSSGSTLKTNGLKEIEQIFYSQAVLVSRKKLSITKQKLLDKLLIRIRAVLTAKNYKYVAMNAPKKALNQITTLIPGLKNPTISPLADKNFVSIASVVEENKFWETIEKLKKYGASGILVLPIEKMIT